MLWNNSSDKKPLTETQDPEDQQLSDDVEIQIQVLRPTEDVALKEVKRHRVWLSLGLFILGLLMLLHCYRMAFTEEEKKSIEGSSLNPMREKFEDFIVTYGREYTGEEKERRFRVFVNNVLYMEEEEKKNPGLDLDINTFTDWEEKEMRQNLARSYTEHEMEGTTRFDENVLPEGVSRPAEMDWRTQGKITPVKNQMQCGSCWAFSIVAAVEAVHAIKKGELVSLSEQELVDCDHDNNGCNGGYRPYGMRFVQSNGLMKESVYPYLGKEGGRCKLAGEEKDRIFINSYKMLSRSEDQIADYVSQNGPVTFGMQVVKSMYSYKNGIYQPSAQDCQNASLGSHALVIVGYGAEGGRNFWWVKNSWGSSWGQSGYFKLARGENSCGAANNVVAPIIN